MLPYPMLDYAFGFRRKTDNFLSTQGHRDFDNPGFSKEFFVILRPFGSSVPYNEGPSGERGNRVPNRSVGHLQRIPRPTTTNRRFL